MTTARLAKQQVWLRRVLLWGPGVVLAFLGDLSAFVIWLGVLSAFGWMITASPSLESERLSFVSEWRSNVQDWITAQARSVRNFVRMPARIAELEAAVADLERRLDEQVEMRMLSGRPGLDAENERTRFVKEPAE